VLWIRIRICIRIRIQWGSWIRIRIRIRNLDLECWMFSFEGFSCSLDNGITKLHFLIQKSKKKFLLYLFFQFLVIKTLDPFPDPDSLEILDPDPYPNPHSMNSDQQLW
jgi:hypothetical protein